MYALINFVLKSKTSEWKGTLEWDKSVAAEVPQNVTALISTKSGCPIAINRAYCSRPASGSFGANHNQTRSNDRNKSSKSNDSPSIFSPLSNVRRYTVRCRFRRRAFNEAMKRSQKSLNLRNKDSGTWSR